MEYEEFMVDRYLGDEDMGEFPPVTAEDLPNITSDPEERHELLDFWNDAKSDREQRLRRYLGHMGML